MRPTRDRLIDAATSLLDRGGPGAVTLREVGRLAGVSHNAPYKRFADKADLLAAVAARELRLLQRRLERARHAAPDDAAALVASARAYVRWATAHPVRFKLTFGRWDLDSEELGDAAARVRTEFFEPFRSAARSGALRTDPARAALLVWALAHGAIDLDLTGHLRKDGVTTGPDVLVGDLVALLTDRRDGRRTAGQ